MSELDAKVEMYQDQGWKLKERVGEDRAIMVKKTNGSKLLHLALLLLTFGVGNAIYLLWSRVMNKQELTVHGPA